MRRGRCARRAMLGAVAAGALLGAARGYEIDLIAGETGRADDEYKVVTTAGLEIVIGPSAGSVYDIAPAAPDSPALTFEIAVEGGNPAITPSLCVGGYTLDASSGDIACYGFAKVDPIPAVGAGSIVPAGTSITITPDDDDDGGFDFTTCEGDIDVQIVAGALGDIVCKDANGDVAQTATGATSFTVRDDDSNDVSSTFTLVNCPGGITLDKSENEFVCYGVKRGAAPVTNSVGGSIVVTETSETDAALQEKTTIAGASNTITVNGGADLETEGINYKIELNTDDGAFTKTVTTTTSEDANGVKTDTVTTVVTTNDVEPGSEPATETTEEVTETVTAPNAEIADLLSGAPDDTFPDSFADNTVITIVSIKSADDDDELKLETVVVTTELTESETTTVTDYNIVYSENDDGILGFIKEIKTDKPGSEDESVTTTFFLTGDDSLPDPDGGEIDVTADKYLDLFEEELSSSLTVAEYRNRLPAGGKLPASFKDEDKIKDEAILKFEIEGTFVDPSRLALTANLTTQVSGGTSRKLLQQGGGVTQKETEFRSQIDDDDNIEESLKEVEKDAGGNVIRFSANEIKIEEDPKTGFITLTEIETVNGGTEEQVVTENELVLTSIGGATTVVSNKTTVDGQETFCDPPFAIVCGGSGSAPA